MAAESIIERTRVPVTPMSRGEVRAKSRSRNLDFRMQRQMHSNWCWAAVATSVALFYNPKSKWTQCGVAERYLHQRHCCGKHVNGECNQTGHLQEVLPLVGHAAEPAYVEGKIPFTRAQQEIDAGRPLGVRTLWRDGEGAHFLAIIGYHRGLKMLTVADPIFGQSHVHYRAFSTNYRHSGRWVDSYYTKN